ESIEAEAAWHDGVAFEMAGEEPQVRLHVELSHDAPITMLAALLLHFRDAVEHEHRRQRKLRVAGAEQLPARAGEQVVILELLPPLSHWMSRFSLAINAFRIRGFPNTDQGPSKERGPRARKTAWPILAFDPRPFCQARARLNIAVGESFILYFAGNRTPPINQMRRPRLPSEKPYGDIANLLRGAGLRPTQQRLALAHLLFANGN